MINPYKRNKNLSLFLYLLTDVRPFFWIIMVAGLSVDNTAGSSFWLKITIIFEEIRLFEGVKSLKTPDSIIWPVRWVEKVIFHNDLIKFI
jgi:hypothetical protein